MKPASFSYLRPRSIDEAAEMLAGGDAKVLAGGQSLVPILSMRLASPATLVDINHIAGLDQIEETRGGFRVGCLTRHRDLERYGRHSGVLREAVADIAHPAIRNRGTTVGSLVHADPAAELPAVLVLLGGSVEVVSAARGRRVIDADQLFVGPLESSVAADELAVAATLPIPPRNAGSWWMEVSRRQGDFALVGVAAMLTLDARGYLVSGSLALTGVGLTPVAVDVSDLVAGQLASIVIHRTEEAIFEAVADRVTAVIDPDGDIHATADYRMHLARVLSQRCLFGAGRNAVDADPVGGTEVEDWESLEPEDGDDDE